jgi:hypothetical protein
MTTASNRNRKINYRNLLYLAGPGALSLGKARLTSTNLPSIVWSFDIITSTAKVFLSI